MFHFFPFSPIKSAKQISKSKQNEHLIKMLLRAGAYVNAQDDVSAFIHIL